MTQSAPGVRNPGHAWGEHQGVPREWRRAVGVMRGAWQPTVSAARAEGRGRLRPGVDAGVPSSPSWGCKAGFLAGRGTCGADGACGGDVSAGRRRGCARWGRPTRGRASDCCVWSIPIRCRCQSGSPPRRLQHHHQRGISPRHPQCCQDLYCCDAARPRFSSSRCSDSLQEYGKENRFV